MSFASGPQRMSPEDFLLKGLVKQQCSVHCHTVGSCFVVSRLSI